MRFLNGFTESAGARGRIQAEVVWGTFFKVQQCWVYNPFPDSIPKFKNNLSIYSRAAVPARNLLKKEADERDPPFRSIRT